MRTARWPASARSLRRRSAAAWRRCAGIGQRCGEYFSTYLVDIFLGLVNHIIFIIVLIITIILTTLKRQPIPPSAFYRDGAPNTQSHEVFAHLHSLVRLVLEEEEERAELEDPTPGPCEAVLVCFVGCLIGALCVHVIITILFLFLLTYLFFFFFFLLLL